MNPTAKPEAAYAGPKVSRNDMIRPLLSLEMVYSAENWSLKNEPDGLRFSTGSDVLALVRGRIYYAAFAQMTELPAATKHWSVQLNRPAENAG
jgi:hypothetical protein